MALRAATRHYDLATFQKEYKSSLRMAVVLLPAGTTDGPVADDLKLDIVLPDIGRIGPMDAQVINRFPDGSVALQLPSPPPELKAAFKTLLALPPVTAPPVAAPPVAAPPVAAPALPVAAPAQEAPAQTAPPESHDVPALLARIHSLEEEVATLRAALAEAQIGADGHAHERAEGQERAEAAQAAPAARTRGLPILDLSRMAPWRQGRIDDRSLRDAFMAIAVEKLTGMLTIQYGGSQELQRWGYWLKGGPVGWRAEPMQEQEVLGMLLYRAQQITKEQLQQSLDLMERSGVRQGDAMIEMGVISFPSLVMLLQKQTEFVLQQVFRDQAAKREGTWTFHVLPELPEKFIAPPVRVAQLLYRQLRVQAKDLPAEALATYLRPNLDRYVYLARNVERTIEEMKLSTEESQFTKIMSNTSYRTREMFAVSNLARSATAAILWCFNELSLLEFRAEEASARSTGRFDKMIEDRRRQMTKGTLFDRLELHWICNRFDVDTAWKKFQIDLAEENLAHYPASLKEEVAKWRKLAKDAYDRLSDDRARREYRVTVMDKTMVEQSAEMLFKKGDMAVMKNAFGEAVECMEKAHELMPNVGEYKEGLQRMKALKG